MYLNNPFDIEVFGSPMFLVAKNDFDNLTIYNFVKMIIKNKEVLSKIDENFKIHEKDMVDNYGVLDYHRGSSIYFNELGLGTQKKG